MSAGSRQLRLLLWKDYLVRKRKTITLTGIAWATSVIICLYIVRANVDNVDFPSCQFRARALPSAGMINFIQSFVCNVNNDCNPLDKYDEVPTFENAKLTQLQRRFSPLIYNETILDVASTVPNALKLLAKLSDIVDEPTFIDISKNGLQVQDLFTKPSRTKRYLSSYLNLSPEVMQDLMTAQLNLQGILGGSMKCTTMIPGLLKMEKSNLELLTNKLCSLDEKDAQKIIMDLLPQINFSKYIKMIGSMYSKLSGDDRVLSLGDTVTAVLRMTRLQSFLPAEALVLLQGASDDFSYFNLELITKLIDLFKPTFGDTESYKQLRDFGDMVVAGLKFLSKIIARELNENNPSVGKDDGLTKDEFAKADGQKVNLESVDKMMPQLSDSIDVYNLLSQATKLIVKNLDGSTQHEFLLYATLLAKLIEGANFVIDINMHIEERAYEASLRNPEGVKILTGLPSHIIAKGFDGLIDAGRTQILTSSINKPGQVFCNVKSLRNFFKISKDEANTIMATLCSDAWSKYVADLIRSFGIFDVKNKINEMASILIQETLGKNIESQLYPVEYDFKVLKNFTQTLRKVTTEFLPFMDWEGLLNVTHDSTFMKTVKSKADLGKQVLVVVHGALAKEVISQNPILSYKISPFLIDITTLVTALNEQLDQAPQDLLKTVRDIYPAILDTMMRTANDVDKTLKALTTHSEDMFCNGVENAFSYLDMSMIVYPEFLVSPLCNMSRTIEKGLEKDSIIGRAIVSIQNPNRPAFEIVKWITLINGIKSLYVTLEKDYPYLFEYASYGLEETQLVELERLIEEATKLWFVKKNIGRSVLLGINIGLRVLDLVDRDIWNITNEGWLKVKYSLHAISGPIEIFDDFIKVISAITENKQKIDSKLPSKIVSTLQVVVPNLPRLIVDEVDIITAGDTQLEPIIEILNANPPWPCSNASLADLLRLSEASMETIRSLESVMCADENLKLEWKEYIAKRNVSLFNLKNYNTTYFPPHTFLKFGSAFDSLVEDGALIRKIIQDIIDDTSEGINWKYAWKRIVELFNSTDRDDIMKNFFSKLDTVIPSTNTSEVSGSLFSIWQEYIKCSILAVEPNANCTTTARNAWKHTLQFFSVMFREAAGDLLVFFKEFYETDTTLLQLIGFTKRTPLYDMYNNLGHYMGVLLNSYWDFGFMSQVRKASLSQFWDCEGIMSALVPPPGSIINTDTIKRIEPFICPSFLYWLSLPKGVNTILDVVAKPQYYFYTIDVNNLTTTYEEAYDKINELTNFLTDIRNKNHTLVTEDDIKMNTLQYKLEKLVNNVLNYQLNTNDTSYQTFNDINKKQFATNVYLTRVVSIINKIATNIANLNISNDYKDDLKSIEVQSKRRPDYFIAVHFDLITDVIWTNDEKYTLIEAMDKMCDQQLRDSNKKILLDEFNVRVRNVICSKKYNEIYSVFAKSLDDDLRSARFSLLNLVNVLQNGTDDEVDVFDFFNERDQVVSSIKKSIFYAYELSLPIYLKYLQSNLQHYDVILTFLAGGDWWRELRGLYNGPYANKFFDSMEKSFEITEDVLGHLDKIHLVRLLRDINVNQSDAFCQPNITLSDYVPDSTGALSELKRTLCETEPSDLYEELPPLLFASQGYTDNLKLTKEVNYTSLNLQIAKTEALLDADKELLTPQRPHWVTEERLNSLRKVAFGLLSKETLTSIAFGVLSNAVDAGTLFLSDSPCHICSHLTSWIKQLNLQVFKKQEYDSLLCHLDDMTLNNVYHTLKNDFHWDMAFHELILTRNYTKYELNKSLNEFLELVKLHLLEDMLSEKTKLADCLAGNVTRNAFGNATLFVTILSKTARLLRAQAPHLQEVDGLTSLPYFVQLERRVARNLDVYQPLKKYMGKDFVKRLEKITDEKFVKDVSKAEYNLRLLINNDTSIVEVLDMRGHSWADICVKYNCNKIGDVIRSNVNRTLIAADLPTHQTKKFWQFTFVSDILKHIEDLLHHMSRLLAVVSRVDVQGVMEGRLASMVDFLLVIINDDVTADILYSLEGLATDLHPLLADSELEHDMKALASGLNVLLQLKNYLVEKENLKVDISKYFPHSDRVEIGLERLGINNTNFWSIAAPRIQAGNIHLKPIFSPKPDIHISNFVCQMESMSQVIHPSNLDVVTADDVFGATVEQFCCLSDERVKQIVSVLLGNLNYSAVIERVTNILLPKLYASANLTSEEGSSVLDQIPQMAELMPIIQENVGDLTDTIAKEPLVQSLKGAESLGGLLESYSFQKGLGDMLCGEPLPAQDNRFFKAIAQSTDFSSELDQAQLEVLPTAFCRNMYKEIMNIKGGKILWSFIKPLLMGKILYTPQNAAVDRIVQKANSTFAHMIKLVSIIHSFADSFPRLEDLSSHRAGVKALRDVISSPSFAGLKDMLVGNASVPDVDIDQAFGDFGELKGIGALIKRGSDILRCINLNRFVAVDNEFNLTHQAVKLSRVNEFSAGLVFMNTAELNENPSKVEYKIRMDIDNAPTTARMKNYLWIPGPESSFIENMRYFRGFVQLQDMIDKAIIELSRSNTSRVKRQTRMEDSWDVYTQQEPYPCYRKDYYQTSIYESQAMIVAFFFSLLFTVASAVRFIVSDKESGNTMLMSVMGVNLSYHTLSWFVACMIEMVATVTCMTVVLKLGHVLPRTDTSLVFMLLLIYGVAVISFCFTYETSNIIEILATVTYMTIVLKLGHVLPRTDTSLVFMLLLVYGVAVISFCYMMSKLFWSASFAAVCTAIAYLFSFMPFVVILSLEAVISTTVKLIVCLSMSTSISYSFLYIARFEAMGSGVQWGDIWSAPAGEELSVATGVIMTLFDTVLYFVIGCLLDRFFGPKTLASSITNSTTSSEKAGVSITNVSKIYNEGSRRAKVALDNVSIELHKGQVTALLGHNGAGKTTLINILTGSLKPSKGHITIRSEPSSHTRVGICPQKDVLFEQLTASEHVALYAQLKSGLPIEELKEEVQSILRVLSLGAICDEPVCRLSGGTRRRLCVALAFVARPQLVSLDEPTAGVDPAARRDIWSMIVKLRQDRTILLTTHHLDEAELLSDQIVIMHRGQVHTTGSPIEIKRSLGNGYRLAVLYPKPGSDWSDDDEQISLEERAKQLVAVVTSRVKNAALVETNDSAVEMQLPLFDADGVHNNFLQLCTSLEDQQSTLGFSGYSLECSTLEHVFFNICNQADGATTPNTGIAIEYNADIPSKSASTSSIKSDKTPLVPADGPLKGTSWEQFCALLHARYIHYKRNRWLLFLLIVLPSLFVATAMAFSLIRPPPDNEIALRLNTGLYRNTTRYIIPHPSVYNSSNDSGEAFAQRVMDMLLNDVHARNWSEEATPKCSCGETKQICELNETHYDRPEMMIVPDTATLNEWIVKTHDAYIDKRYGGFSSSVKNNKTHLIVWYNNKGHHAMPSFLNALNNAILKSISGDSEADITVYSHPLKISKEQISKDTVYQHVADAGISALVLVGYCLVSAGAAVYLVSSRVRQEKRLQLLCGVTPLLYWLAALAVDMIVILINMGITVIVFEAFGFPVFVAKSNLPAICLLIILYGFACGTLIHVLEKLFVDASMANMLLFCGNAFLGLAGITLLLILDVISESDATDNARWTLHKIFMICPQFVLADGMLEIAKNTIQAQVLQRFGMDTYKDPLTSSLIAYHYVALVLVGTALFLLNLAIEYSLFEVVLVRFRSESISESNPGEMEDLEVAAERKRVQIAISQRAHGLVRIPTIGNINAGFVDTEVKHNSIKRVASPAADAALCLGLGKAYRSIGGYKTAVRSLTIGIPTGQCTALLGQNGAGKSTTFKMLTGETRPTAGQIYLNDKPADHRELCKGLISYCPQTDAIDPLMTVRETLQFYCRLRGITESEEVIRRTIEMFDLAKYADVQNGTLSGGNKRKLCTAIAFMGRTPLVLLDEPTSGMDPVSRLCVSRSVSSSLSRAVLLSTHALDDARRLASRVALLRDGRLGALATLDDCLKRFGGGYVVACRCSGSDGSPRSVWRRIKQLAPHARLKVMHHSILHFLLPLQATLNKKEITTKLSDVFRLMGELQTTCDIEDYTVNQSSLDQMFLSFTENKDEDLDTVDVEPLPTPKPLRRDSSELNSITAL